MRNVRPAYLDARRLTRERQPLRLHSATGRKAGVQAWLVVLLLWMVLGLLASAAGAAAASAGYRVDQLQRRLALEQDRHRQLESELAALQSAARIEQEARLLGMDRPQTYTPAPVVAVHDAPPPAGRQVVVAVAAPERGPALASSPPAWLVAVKRWATSWLGRPALAQERSAAP